MVSGAFGSSGQRCMAVTTVVAVGDIADELVAAAAGRARRMVVGAGSDATADIGPVTTPQAYERITGIVGRGVESGATLVVDGREVDAVDAREGGFFIGPCLFDHVRPDMELYREEIFGPVLIVVRVATLDEALELIRANPYGNGSAIFTRSGAAAHHFRQRVPTGGVGINVPIPVPLSYYPLGGWKDSRMGVHGVNFGGFEFFTRRQTVTMRWEAPRAGVDFAFPTND
jgi:malonate-semialdehyde dehydrogenase (acetylating)/methylmalonate-semialdehyde dehydrogenase